MTRVTRGGALAAFVVLAFAVAGCSHSASRTSHPVSSSAASEPTSVTVPSTASSSSTDTSNTAPVGGTTESATLTSGGLVRTYLVHVPTGGATGQRLPVIIAYHGADDTAADMEQQTGLDALADRDHFLAVYPQGYQDTWNEGAGHTPAERAGVDDVAFTAALIAALKARFTIDAAKIAATGFSNGALLVQLLGCRLAAQLTLIAPVSGQLPTSVSPTCSPSRPISVLEFHGTADPTIPYGGGPFAGVGGGTSVLSAPASVQRWAALDGCASSPRVSTAGSTTASVYAPCRGSVSVSLDAISGGGHDWPADASQDIWQALSAAPG